MNMPKDHFFFYKDFLYEKSGLALNEQKIYLLESRLDSVAKKWGFPSLEEMTKALLESFDPAIGDEVIDAMTTNETLFFRDDRPFKYISDTIIPQIIKNKQDNKKIRIWSAACSTGQEPYSIIMSLLEALPDVASWNIDMVATDLSDKALEQARKAEFNQFEIQRGLPIQLLMKYFEKDDAVWKLKDEVKNMVKFEKFNLLDSMTKFGEFDMILCRNVLIYFDDETKKKILISLAEHLGKDSFLMLGGAETAIGVCPNLKVSGDCPGLYNFVDESADKAIESASPGATASSLSS